MNDALLTDLLIKKHLDEIKNKEERPFLRIENYYNEIPYEEKKVIKKENKRVIIIDI